MVKNIEVSLLYYAIIFALLFSQVFSRNAQEIDRLALVLAAMTATTVAWFKMRGRFNSKLGLLLFGLPLLELAIACMWSALNFVRFNLYEGAVDGQRPFARQFWFAIEGQSLLEQLARITAIVFVVLLLLWVVRYLNAPSGFISGPSTRVASEMKGPNV